MSDVTITVRGESETHIAPERASIHITVRSDGAERSTVVERAMTLAEPIRTNLAERQHAGSVIEWTSKRLAVRAERPWNDQGKQLAPVYYASIDFTATFVEASELSLWVTEISPWDGVDVGWVNWHLTPQTRARTEREVASAAVKVAVTRAEAYAEALHLTTVTAREIADVGLISSGQQPAAPPMMRAYGAELAAGAAPAMEYEPDDIVVSAAVEARFSAR